MPTFDIPFDPETEKRIEEAAASCPVKLTPVTDIKSLTPGSTRVQNLAGDCGLVRWVGNCKTSWGKGEHVFVQFDVPLPMNPYRSDGQFNGEQLLGNAPAPAYTMGMVPVRHLNYENAPQAINFLRNFFGARANFLHDVELLKFWLARKFDAFKTLEMLENHLLWHSEVKMNPDTEWFDPSIAEEFPIGMGEGTDIDGNLLHYARPTNGGVLTPNEFLAKHGTPVITRWHMLEVEELKIRLREAGYTTSRRASVIYDLKNLGAVGSGVIEYAKIMAALDQNHNPEVMGRVYMINAPFFFRAIFKVISVFVDEHVKDKIKVFGGDYSKDLSNFIDPKYHPEFAGGKNATWYSKKGRIGQEKPAGAEGSIGGQNVTPLYKIFHGDVDKTKGY